MSQIDFIFRTLWLPPESKSAAQSPYTLATVKLALSKYRERDPRRGPRSLGLAPKKNALRSWLTNVLPSMFPAPLPNNALPTDLRRDDLVL
jgi:hypothetical protein